MTAGWQSKYSIGNSNSDEYEEETRYRAGSYTCIHTLNSLRSFSSRQQTQMRALGRAGSRQADRAPLSLSLHALIHDYKGRDYCSHTTRPGRLPLTGESWAGESLRSGSGCGCAVRKPRSGTCGTPWTSITGDGPAVHLVSARRSRRLRLPASKGSGERYWATGGLWCIRAHSDAAWLIIID